MPEYRFYNIKKNGHVAGPPSNHDLANDIDAVREATRLLNGHDIEIWQGPRVVGYLVPEKKP